MSHEELRERLGQPTLGVHPHQPGLTDTAIRQDARLDKPLGLGA